MAFDGSRAGLIDQIYEAAVLPDGWPALLDRMGSRFGGLGGLIFSVTDDGERWVDGPRMAEHRRAFVDEGWHKCNDRVQLLLQFNHCGFLTETDVLPLDELDQLPVRQQFLIPRGLIAADATLVRGFEGEPVVFSVEGFPTHEAARAAIPELDGLRPHLARAVSLSAQIRFERARAGVSLLETMGSAAALIGGRRRLLAANAPFQKQLGQGLSDTPSGLRLADPTADAAFGLALAQAGKDPTCGRSIVLSNPGRSTRSVLHMLPIAGAAQNVFVDARTLIILAEPCAIPRAPEQSLVQTLFDLTPAEAKVAQGLASGGTVETVAQALSLSTETIRTHLKHVYSKVGISRQAELVVLMNSVAGPQSSSPSHPNA